MNNKGFWSMVGLNIFAILIFSVFLLKSDGKEIVISGEKYADTIQSQIIGGIINTSGITVQIIAEDKESYYQDGEENSILEKQSILRKGSGIIVSKTGYIITNKHVIDDINLKYSIITNDGKILPVDNIREDDLLDLAILHVNIDSVSLSEARFVDINSMINVGQLVYAIGNPLSEYPNTVSLGIISGKGRKIDVNKSNTPYYAGLYQTDAALNPGNSGGPLINLSGEVLGMITAISRGGNNIGFAIPLNSLLIDSTMDIIQNNNDLLRPYLGILYSDTVTGAKIDTILPDSPVSGKLSVGDIIIEIDKRAISLSTPLLYYLYTYKPTETVIFSVIRGNQIMQFPIVLGQKTL